MPDRSTSGLESMLEVDSALNRLASINAHVLTVVELRAFEGFEPRKIAARMECGPAIGVGG